MTSPEHGAWVTAWLTAPRFQKYVTAAGGDRGRALALYDWNAQLAAAWLRDVGHLEVGLRNAYDRALLSHPALGGADWLHTSQHGVLFPPRLDLRGVDANAGMRGKIRGAHRTWRHQAALPPRGKVLAEIPFSFWTSLTAQEHEATIWTPVLHRALHAGTDRTKVHPRLAEIRELRNRAAHMERWPRHRPGPHEHSCQFEVCRRRCPRWGSNPHCADFKSAASASWATGACCPRGVDREGRFRTIQHAAAPRVETDRAGAHRVGTGRARRPQTTTGTHRGGASPSGWGDQRQQVARWGGVRTSTRPRCWWSPSEPSGWSSRPRPGPPWAWPARTRRGTRRAGRGSSRGRRPRGAGSTCRTSWS